MSYRYILKIKGMRCGMCESHINSAIRNNFKIKKVKSSRHKEETVIESDEILDEEKLIKVIKDTGYYYEGLNKEIKEQ